MTMLYHQGLAVPWVAVWSDEVPNPEDHPLHLRNGKVHYDTEAPGDRDNLGVLWTRAGVKRGSGVPEFGQIHGLRQRACMTVPRCQVCGQRMPALRFLLGSHQDGHEKGSPFITGTPPTCEDCTHLAAVQCPHLRQIQKEARLTVVVPTDVRVWGYYGDLADTQGHWTKGQRVQYGSPELPLLLAKQLLVAIISYEETPYASR
jgi:hypothetical protein